MTATGDLQHQIEQAFDYRGNATIHFKDGTSVEGFVFNREFPDTKALRKNIIEVFVAGSGEAKTFSIADISSVTLTGEDHAAGKSYEEWLKKHPPQN